MEWTADKLPKSRKTLRITSKIQNNDENNFSARTNAGKRKKSKLAN